MKRRIHNLFNLGFIISLICLMATGICNVQPVYASSVGCFTVQAVIPENQVDKKQSYFDLRIKPSQKQTVQVIVKNGDENPISVNIALNSASTGRGGQILYNQPNVRDKSMELSITDVARVVTPHLTVPGFDSAVVDIEIDMLDTIFDGVLLGGLLVSVDSAKHETSSSQSSIRIQNEYAYILGFKITQNDSPVEPELHLISIESGLVNYHTAVIVNLQNSSPVIIKELNLEAEVYKKGSSNVFKSFSAQNAEMAPNSNGDFLISWNNQPLQAGDYRLKMTAELHGKIWEWDSEFSIKEDRAVDANANAVELVTPQKDTWHYVVIIFLSICLIILAVVVFVMSRRRSNQ